MQPTRTVLCGTALLASFASLAGTTALADTLTFTATLNGASERPNPTLSTGTGFATVTLSGNILSVNENFTGLTAPASAGHIHCCAGADSTAPVEVGFPNFPHMTSGMYTQSFDLSMFTFGSPGFTETQLIDGLESGLAYVNIHDMNYPAGEIRGQLLPVASTPEPGTFLLLGTGMAGLLSFHRRFARR